MNSSVFLLVSLFILFGSASAQFNCTENHWCSGRGVCLVTNECDCFPGYYTHDCSKTVLDYIGPLYTAFEIYIMVLCCFVIIGAAGVLFYTKRAGYVASKATLSFFNTKTALLLALMGMAIDIILYFAIDAGPGFKHRVHLFVPTLIFDLILSFLSLVFCIMLFQWAEVYYSTIEILRREEMLEKINARYKSNVTLEDVLKSVKVINRLKIPFGLVATLSFIISIFNAVISNYFPIHAYPFRIFWAVYFSLMFFGYSLGFLIFGRRLITVMPAPLQKKMRRITNLLSFISIFYLFVWIFDFVMFTWVVGPPGVYIFADFIGFTVVLLIAFLLLSMFIRFVPKFPFITLGDGQSSSLRSGGATDVAAISTTTANESADIESTGQSEELSYM